MTDRIVSVGDDLTIPAGVIVPVDRVDGLGTAATADADDFATSSQGAKADAADTALAGRLSESSLSSTYVPLGHSPLALLRDRSTKAATYASVGPAAGQALTLVTLTGAGTISSLWTTCDILEPNLHRIQVFVDGEASPSIDVELGVMALSALGSNAQANPAMEASTTHMHVEGYAANSTGFTMRYPIPYSNGCVVKLYNPTASNNSVNQYVWCQAVYSNETSALRLKSSSVPLAQGVTVGPVIPYQMCNLKGAGWLVWHGIAVTGSVNTWAERDIDIYVDGEAMPSIQSTGTEDYFRSSFYWLSINGSSRFDTPVMMVPYHNGPTTLTALDWLALAGGVRFTSQLRIVMDQEIQRDASTITSMGWVVLYYEAAAVADAVAPTPGTLTYSIVSTTAATLKVVEASDDREMAQEPYSYSTDGGATWSSYRSAPTFAMTGLAEGQTYQCQHRVKDRAGNVATGAVIAVNMAASSYRYVVMSDAPVAYWPLGDTGATALDLAGASHLTYTATAATAPALVVGGDGAHSATVDGVATGTPSAKLQCVAGAITMEAVVKRSAGATNQTVLECRSGSYSHFYMSIAATAITVGWHDGSWRDHTFTYTLPLDAPTHLAAVAGTDVRLYVNGALVGTLAKIGAPIAMAGGTIGLGVTPTVPTKRLTGVMDDMAIYGTALSAERILAHAQAAGRA